MQQRFKGKVAIVTGAASGIGKATAERLGQEGAKILCADLDEAGAQVTADTINNNGEAQARAFNVTDPEACVALIEDTVNTFGKLDILCNIAGIGGLLHTKDETVEGWNRMMDVNINGPFFLSQAAMPQLLENKGNIINLASVAGVIGQAYTAAYCASKHALVGLTKSMALEYGRQGVRVNAICPGTVRTKLLENFSFPEGIDLSLIDRYNFTQGGMTEPEEVASMIAQIASAESHYINGASISIDGGTSAG